MFLHLHIPGFHAAVHQAMEPALRGRPVAVAVDGGDQAALFDVSIEARTAGIWPGFRAAPARHRCPGLRVVTPRPELYQRAHRALLAEAVSATPRAGGKPGAIDLDLGGTEVLWRHACGSADAGLQAVWWAERLRDRIRGDLRLPAALGVSARLRIARLAAFAAREGGLGLRIVLPGGEAEAIAPWPVRWLRDLPHEVLRPLADCGVETFGALAALAPVDVRRLLGRHAELPLAVLAGDDEPEVPVFGEPERELAASCEAGPAGADAERAARLLAGLARDLGFRLRAEGCACTRLALAGTWLDGRTTVRACRPPRQLRHDDELSRTALALLAPLARRVAWERLALTAGGLLPAEEQQELLAPPRGRKVQGARDLLRARFGGEMVGGGGG